jgi:formylglycine-generating enzyme required for sulfatase activity
MNKRMILTLLITAVSFTVSVNSYAEPIEPEMVEIPAGNFTMGHDKWASYVDNKPAHPVTIKKFALAKHEVTNKEFQQFLTETKYILKMDTLGRDYNCIELTFKDEKPLFRKFSVDWKNVPAFEPAVCIGYEDIESYVTWLAKSTNKPYRLPSEAEWEYSARAGTKSKFFYGNDKHQACAYGNINDVNRDNNHECDDGYKDYAPIGMFKANPWGLFDIIGNADEFVADCDHGKGYQGAPKDQKPWNDNCGSGLDARYIRRGGAAMVNINHLTERAHMGPGMGSVHAGFRIAMDLPNKQSCLKNQGLCSVNQTTQKFRQQLSAAQAAEKLTLLKKSS